jgi:hypothetical protein
MTENRALSPSLVPEKRFSLISAIELAQYEATFPKELWRSF